MTFIESSPKAGWLSLRALRKRDAFPQELYESRMIFVESSTKAGWLSLRTLRKQDDFCWELFECRMTFVESSEEAGWHSLRALQKQLDFCPEIYGCRMTFVKSSTKALKKCVNRDSTKFRGKIAYVGGPSFRRRPWPFGERRSRVCATSATLMCIGSLISW